MSAKGGACDHHGNCERHKLHRRLFALLLTLIVLVLLTVLIIWLVLRPTKPKFYLRDVTVVQFNLTSSSSISAASTTLTALLQVTLQSKNPNDRIGIYYDRLDAYAVYKNQQVTVPTSLPPGYQGHGDLALWSPNLYGTSVSISPFLAEALDQDENAGFLLVDVRVGGRVRWKVGTWISGRYHLYVNCPAFLTVSKGGGGAGGGGGGGSNWGYHLQQQMASCSVNV